MDTNQSLQNIFTIRKKKTLNQHIVKNKWKFENNSEEQTVSVYKNNDMDPTNLKRKESADDKESKNNAEEENDTDNPGEATIDREEGILSWSPPPKKIFLSGSSGMFLGKQESASQGMEVDNCVIEFNIKEESMDANYDKECNVKKEETKQQADEDKAKEDDKRSEKVKSTTDWKIEENHGENYAKDNEKIKFQKQKFVFFAEDKPSHIDIANAMKTSVCVVFDGYQESIKTILKNMNDEFGLCNTLVFVLKKSSSLVELVSISKKINSEWRVLTLHCLKEFNEEQDILVENLDMIVIIGHFELKKKLSVFRNDINVKTYLPEVTKSIKFPVSSVVSVFSKNIQKFL